MFLEILVWIPARTGPSVPHPGTAPPLYSEFTLQVCYDRHGPQNPDITAFASE